MIDAGLTVKAAVLQSVLRGPVYGRQLMATVHDASGGHTRLSEGSLYPALQTLERDGLLRRWTVRVRGARGRPRTYFELTPKGIALAMRQHERIVGLLDRTSAQPPSSSERLVMAGRIRRCAELSASLSDLEASMRRAKA